MAFLSVMKYKPMNATIKTLLEQQWNESSTQSTRQILKIISEFVTGFETMADVGPCISIFGSARTPSDNPYYALTVEIGEKLARQGFGIITGGGPGIMEAGNKGAALANGKSIGLNILLPFEQFDNKYVDRDKLLQFDYFFARKVMFTKYSQGFVVMPGGFGTLDELFEVATLIQTGKLKKMPIILAGRSYWEGLVKWIKEVMLKERNINPEDIDLFQLADTADEVAEHMMEYYKSRELSPNFQADQEQRGLVA